MSSMGFRLDDDDEDSECEPSVRDGHVATADNPVAELKESLAARLDAIRQLRAMGATTCRVGDVEATFPLAPVALPQPEAPRRQLNRPHDPDELTPEELDYVP